MSTTERPERSVPKPVFTDAEAAQGDPFLDQGDPESVRMRVEAARHHQTIRAQRATITRMAMAQSGSEFSSP